MKSTLFAIPLFSLVFFGQGCFGPSKSSPKGPDLGVYKSVDGGQTWIHKRAFVSGSKVTGGVAGMSVLALASDPQDRLTVYLGTAEHGMVFSLDGGESWQQAKTLGASRVQAVAVDPKDKCTVYAASGNKIYKTETCSRDWKQIFFDPRSDVSFTELIVDWYNPTILYAGSSDGDIFFSRDSGTSWRVSARVDGMPITSLAMDPRDSRVVYAGTHSNGLLKTADGGATWTEIKQPFSDDLQDARRVAQVVVDPVTAQVVYSVSKYGIVKSSDGGATWTPLRLTSPPSTVVLHALAIDPKNTKRLIVTGASTLQLSIDGGATWTPKKLPSSQVGSALLMDPLEANTIYLGIIPAPKK